MSIASAAVIVRASKEAIHQSLDGRIFDSPLTETKSGLSEDFRWLNFKLSQYVNEQPRESGFLLSKDKRNFVRMEGVKCLNIQRFKLDALNPAKYNPRKTLKPGDKEFEKLKNSIQTFGYVEPIVVNVANGNTVISGHQRLSVLRDLARGGGTTMK